MALVTGEVHMELHVDQQHEAIAVFGPRVLGESRYSPAPPTQPYWNLLLPFEQRGPRRWRLLAWARWAQRHNRIFALERELGFHRRNAHDVLPWMKRRDGGYGV